MVRALLIGAFMVLGEANIIQQFSEAFEAIGAAWVMWLLIGLSIMSVAVMLERALYFLTHSLGDNDAMHEQLSKGDLDAALKTVGDKRGMEAEVVRAGIEAAPNGPDSVEAKLQATIARERLRYERFLSYLGTLGNN